MLCKYAIIVVSHSRKDVILPDVYSRQLLWSRIEVYLTRTWRHCLFVLHLSANVCSVEVTCVYTYIKPSQCCGLIFICC